MPLHEGRMRSHWLAGDTPTAFHRVETACCFGRQVPVTPPAGNHRREPNVDPRRLQGHARHRLFKKTAKMGLAASHARRVEPERCKLWRNGNVRHRQGKPQSMFASSSQRKNINASAHFIRASFRTCEGGGKYPPMRYPTVPSIGGWASPQPAEPLSKV